MANPLLRTITKQDLRNHGLFTLVDRYVSEITINKLCATYSIKDDIDEVSHQLDHDISEYLMPKLLNTNEVLIPVVYDIVTEKTPYFQIIVRKTVELYRCDISVTSNGLEPIPGNLNV